jgi:hypothetical protein
MEREMRELYIEGVSDPTVAPSHASAFVRAWAKRWQGYVQAGLLSREICSLGCRRCS